MKTVEVGGKKYVKNRKGALVPEEDISPKDRRRYALVDRLVSEAEMLSAQIADFRQRTRAALGKELVLSVADPLKSEWTADLLLESSSEFMKFDGSASVEWVNEEMFRPDPGGLAEAQALLSSISDGLEDKTARTLLKRLLNLKAGRSLDYKQVRKIEDLEIADERWPQALHLLKSCLKSEGVKQYPRFYRADSEGQLKMVPLSISQAG